MIRPWIWAVTLASVPLLAVGCGSPLPTPNDRTWKAIDEGEFTEVQKGQKAKAVAAKEAMFNQLLSRLMKEIGTGGPGQAISVCQQEAPKIAQQIAKEHALTLGRTSAKLRNTKNTPPGWAKAHVEQENAVPAHFVSSRDDLGVLLPIKLQQPCLLCHGPTERIPPEVKDALAKLYPKDQATGFQENDLRGWFWIEVPAKK